ncbi:MAG: hypothetical protein WCR27_10170, partial [Eubacteriales bacterium]
MMGQYDDYYTAQKFIETIFEKEMIGPQIGSSDENEVLEGYPLNSYVSGILWAQNLHARTQKDADEVSACSDDEKLQINPLGEESLSEIDETVSDDTIAKASIRRPSTMGISFCLPSTAKMLLVEFQFGKYTHSEREIIEESTEGKESKRRIIHEWTRRQYSIAIEFDVSSDQIFFYPTNNEKLNEQNLRIVLTKRMGNINSDRLFTISVENKETTQQKEIPMNEKAFFQCKLILSVKNGEFFPLIAKFDQILDIEDEILQMQYRDIHNFAQGHGCATQCLVKNEICKQIESKFIPRIEISQMKSIKNDKLKIFGLDYWRNVSKTEAIDELYIFVGLYKKWLSEQRVIGTSLTKFQRAINDCIKKIELCINRIENGIAILNNNDNAWEAFLLMNEAMLMQRISMAIKKNKINSKKDFVLSSARWYPFQLFYLIMMIPDLTDGNSLYANVVDLLWFPTGGGKTEAYLAVSAFIIFYERILKKSNKFGTTIIMRYTLRLLTVQQFERAAALICACESLRKEYKLGQNEISIGLWIGNDNSPKDAEIAEDSLATLRDGKDLYGKPNPIQITVCPICGQKLYPNDYSTIDNHMYIKCPNGCLGDHLPIYINDNDIYDFTPTLVISTVDKFARIVWEEKAGRIFGCNMECNKPRLIIQDELHLISGPLGTLTGLYETAVDRLCWDGNHKPKIIASTATVKNAKEQIFALYNRDFFQFPPSGLDNKSTFFAEIATKDERPYRTYLGLTEQGGSMIDLMIRSFSVLCLSVYFMEKRGVSKKVIDQYYTI